MEVYADFIVKAIGAVPKMVAAETAKMLRARAQEHPRCRRAIVKVAELTRHAHEGLRTKFWGLPKMEEPLTEAEAVENGAVIIGGVAAGMAMLHEFKEFKLWRKNVEAWMLKIAMEAVIHDFKGQELEAVICDLGQELRGLWETKKPLQ